MKYTMRYINPKHAKLNIEFTDKGKPMIFNEYHILLGGKYKTSKSEHGKYQLMQGQKSSQLNLVLTNRYRNGY